MESLFRAGLDHLALELRPGIYLCSKLELPIVVGMNLPKVIRRPFPGVTDVQGLASRLLEVALLRVAKVTFRSIVWFCIWMRLI